MSNKPYVRVYLGDGSWVDTQDPPSKLRRVIGFTVIAALTLWPVTLGLLSLTALYVIKLWHG